MVHFKASLFFLAVFICHCPFAIAESSDRPVRFRAILSLSSSTGPFARACARGIELAAEDVNSSGGIEGRRLEVLIEDFQESDLKRAVSAARKLIAVDKADVILSNWSEDAEVVAPIAAKEGLVSMTLGAGGPHASRFASTAFRATTSDDELAQAAVRAERAGGANSACLVAADTGYYVDISKIILSSWKDSGGKVALNESLTHGTRDVLDVVTKIRAARCDSIFLWAAPATIGPLVTQLRQQKVQARRVLPWFAATEEVLARTRGDDQAYTLHAWSFQNTDFEDRYRKRYGESMVRPAGNCYDGVRVIAFVMGTTGTDGSKMREGLLHLRDYVGVTGPFVIRPDRERTGEYFKSFVIRDGKLIEAS